MVDASKLVRRRTPHVLVPLGDRFEPLVKARLGERFGAAPAKEQDFVLDLEGVRAQRDAPQ